MILVLITCPSIGNAADALPQDGAPIRTMTIEIMESVPNGFDWQGLVRALSGVKEGDVLTRETLDKTETALASFGEVNTEVQPTPQQGVDLTIRLVPYERIKSITVDGMYPLFEQDVRSVMTITPGSFLTKSLADTQEKLIRRRYRQEGYIDPHVTLTWRADEEDGHLLVRVNIDKGPFFKLGQITFNGNIVFQSDTLKRRMGVWQKANGIFGQGRFIEGLLKEDMRTLTALYRQRGFADVVVDHATSPDIQSQRVDVNVTIVEGPHTTVNFTGNSFFSTRVLEKDLELFKTGNRGNGGLRRSVHNIHRRYLMAGFADVKVNWQEDTTTPASPDQRNVRMIIEEGQRHIVSAVILGNNAALSDDILRPQLLTRPPSGFHKGVYVAQVLEEDIASLQALYLQNGFLDARVTQQVDIDPQTKQVTVALSFDEGVQTRVGAITFSGDAPIGPKRLRSVLQMQSGEPFRPYLVENEENLVAEKISPLGYPHVRVKGTASLSADRKTVAIDYAIHTGPYVTVGELFFTGNFRTRPDIVRRELQFKEGDPFSLAKVLEAQRNLRDLDLFESVQVRSIGLKEESSTVPLLFETPEKRPYFFEIGGGYQTDKGVYGRTKFGDHNFRGADKDVWTGAEVGDTGYRWDAGITSPRIFGSRIRTDLGLFVERREEFNQDFGTDTVGSTLSFSRRLCPHITTSLGLRFERRDQFLREQETSTEVDPDTLEQRLFLVTTPTIRYDDRDSFIRPTKGWFSSFSVDISEGLEGSVDNFVRYKFDLRTFYTPMHKFTLAVIGRAGYLAALSGSTDLPEDQLFFLGGTTDVRGFGENLLRYDAAGNPVGGRLALSGSLEARYDLGRSFELALFVDGGSIQEALTADGTDDWRWSAGLGLRYITPIGPLGLLYGRKLNPQEGEESGQFHFSIGYTF